MAHQVQITKLPIRSELFVNDDALVLNQFYDINPNSIRVENPTNIKGEPFDSFTYKIKNGDVISKNTGTVVINFETDKTTTPVLVNEIKTLLINTSFYLDTLIDFENNFDRIKIKSITGLGNWTYKGNPIVENQIIMNYDLVDNLLFIASDSIVRDDYAQIEYETGNISFFHPQTNTVVIKTFSLGAEIVSYEYVYTIDGTLEKHQYNVDILKGLPQKDYIVEVDPTLFVSINAHADNKIEVRDSNDILLLEVNDNVITNFSSVLNRDGIDQLKVIIFNNVPNTLEESINLKLLSVDGLAENVNTTFEKVNLIIPPTPLTNIP